MNLKLNQSGAPLGLLVGLLAIAACALPARAQSIYGPGGLFINPTADMPPKGQITPAALELQESRNGAPGRLTWTSYNLDYGATDDLEVGVTYLKVNPGRGVFDHGSAGAYAKYRILKERPGRPISIAVGGSYLDGGDNATHTAFAALRWTVTPTKARRPVHVHVGAIYVDEMDWIKRKKARPYIGIDFRAAHNLSIFAEERAGFPTTASDGSDGAHIARSIGFAWHPVENYTLVLAYGSNGWSKDDHLGIGVGYSIGGGR